MAVERGFCRLANIWVLAVWFHGLNAAPQQMSSDPGLIPSFDSVQLPQPQPQSQPQPQPQPQQQQQSRPILQDLVDQKPIGANDNTNNMTPLDLNICSDSNYRSVDTLPGLRRSSEVRTLQLGQSGVIWPMGNRSIPFNGDCTLQLSACAACQILISWNTPPADIRLLLSDQQQVPGGDRDNKISCESIWDFR